MAFSNSYTHDQLDANFSVTNAAGTADAGISTGGAPSGGWGTGTTNTPSGGGGATGPSGPDAGESGYIYFEASGTSATDVIDFKPDAVFDNTTQNITVTIRTNLNYDTNSHIIPEYTTVSSPTANDWHPLAFIDGTSTDTWASIVLDLSQASGVRKSSTLKYRLRFETNGFFSNDFAISTVDEVGVDATILDTPIESLITTDNLFEENFALTDRSGASQLELSSNSAGLWCYSTSGTGTGGTGPSAPPAGYTGFVFAETSGSTASDTWALTRSKVFDNTADGDLKVFVKHNKNAIATGDMLFQYATVASPIEADWTTLTTIAMNATDAWVDDEFDLSVAEIGSQSTIRYRIKLDLPDSFAADWAIAEAREVIYPAAGGGGATTHTSTGTLEGQGSEVTGTSARVAGPVTHTSSGALEGQGSEVTGTATRFRAFTSVGTLTGQGSTVDGAGVRSSGPVTHTSTGALTGQAGNVSGTGSSFSTHTSSGVLTGQGSEVTGTSVRSTGNLTHESTGSLQGQVGGVDATSTRLRAFTSTGVLEGPGSQVDGTSSVNKTHASSGALEGQVGGITGAGYNQPAGADSGITVYFDVLEGKVRVLRTIT